MVLHFVKNNLDETHRDVSEHDIKKTNQDDLKMIIEECPDAHDDDEKNHIREKQNINAQSYYLN